MRKEFDVRKVFVLGMALTLGACGVLEVPWEKPSAPERQTSWLEKGWILECKALDGQWGDGGGGHCSKSPFDLLASKPK